MTDGQIETQLVLIRREMQESSTTVTRNIEELRTALFGNGRDKKGIVSQVERLAEVADRGRWALRSVLWIGGSLVACLTALAQMRAALTALWGAH